MLNRFATGLALLLVALPLTACGGSGDDDSSKSTQTSPWSGHTYLLSLKQTDWQVPRGIGMDLFGISPAFIFDVSGSGDNLTATLGTSPGTIIDSTMTQVAVTPDTASQDMCDPTTPLTFSGSDYPNSTIGASSIKMHIMNAEAMPPLQVTADVYNLKFTNVLPNGSTPSATSKLEATMDFGELAVLFKLLGPMRDATAVCTEFSQYYTPMSCAAGDASCTLTCQPCPNSSGSATCVSVEADGVTAVEAPNLKLADVPATGLPATCADSTIQ